MRIARLETTLAHAAAVLAACSAPACSRPAKPPEPTSPIAAGDAARALSEASDLCRAEGAHLWGQSLCGPMMFADEATHQAVLSGPSPGATREGALYRLVLPRDTSVANTSMELGGQRWIMIAWPLPQDATRRAILMMHESYHRIQPALGLQGGSGMGTNAHLDSRDGRVWLRGELHALAAALVAEGDARRAAVSDALMLRAYRRSLFPQAAAEERALELNEGLAESTGIDAALRDPPSRTKAAVADLANCEELPSLVRSFAYGTGPAYAELLDARSPDWRRGVHADFDFAAATGAAYDATPTAVSKASAEAALARRGGAEIVGQEDARQKTIVDRTARYAALFVDGPTVELPLGEKTNIGFDPNAVASFEGHGSVYETLQLSDSWGTLKVESGGALVSKDFKRAFVPASPATAPEHPAGAGWTLTLANGYALAPDPARLGSFSVAPSPGVR
jgi:hypothetical protein